MSYTLTKPPKGSNVSGEELLQPLMQTRDSLALQKINHTEWLLEIDDFIEGNLNDCDDYGNDDHSYDTKYTDDRITSYMSGFIVRTIFSNKDNCNDCLSMFAESSPTEDSFRHDFTTLQSKGNLIKSSKAVFTLTLREHPKSF